MSAPESVRRMFENAEEVPAADYAGGEGAPPPPEEEPIEARCALYPLNDYGNGQRFVAYYGENCLFAPRVGWHRWTGRVWQLDEDKIEVRRDAQKISERILDEVEFLALEQWERDAMDLGDAAADQLAALDAKEEPTPADRRKAKELRDAVEAGVEARKELGKRKRGHRSHAKNSGNTGAINNLLIEASVEVSVPIDRMNADSLAINTRSGTIQLIEERDEHAEAWGDKSAARWRYELQPHARESYISKIMPVDFDPEADRSTFEKFLAQIQPDPEIRAFLKR